MYVGLGGDRSGYVWSHRACLLHLSLLLIGREICQSQHFLQGSARFNREVEAGGRGSVLSSFLTEAQQTQLNTTRNWNSLTCKASLTRSLTLRLISCTWRPSWVDGLTAIGVCLLFSFVTVSFLSPVCFLEVWTFSSSKLLWCSEGTGSSRRRRRRGRLVSKLNFICISHLHLLWNESHIEELSVKGRVRRKKSHFLERDQLFLSSSRHGTHSKDGHYWWVSDCWCV